jgi:hypothetical protein
MGLLPEFKAEIVESCQRLDRTVGQVARDFGLTGTAVRSWVKQADLDAGGRELGSVGGGPVGGLGMVDTRRPAMSRLPADGGQRSAPVHARAGDNGAFSGCRAPAGG